MATKEDIQKLLEQNPEYKEKLFIRGYYFTNDEVHPEDYPFYGLWNHEKILGYNLLVHKLQTYYIHKFNNNKSAMILVGHAYNPFTMQYKEAEILQDLAKLHNTKNFWNKFNELTGIFTLIIIEYNNVKFVGDPCCQQCCFYSALNKHVYLSSHSIILGDILNLKWDPNIQKLVNYKFFPLLGNDLPGNLSQFNEVQQLLPNHFGQYNNNKINLTRFYYPHVLDKNNNELATEIGSLLHNNMKLILKKWKQPAISMTGGCDSKTTIACANGLYHKFKFFSYSSSDAEDVDAQAAVKISDYMSFNHKLHKISRNDEDFDSELEITRALLDYNTGNIIPTNKNDVRKRHYFDQIDDFDIEVKSWVSEALRAYFSKRFNKRENFGNKPTPRKCTTMYKFFLHNRSLVKMVDKMFEDYLNKYFEQAKENSLPWPEQFYWEQRQASGEGITITGQQRYSFNITIPYNNRRIMELFLSASVHDKIYDKIHSLVRQQMNPKIDEPNILVVNLKHTKNRAKLENLYYAIHSRLPI